MNKKIKKVVSMLCVAGTLGGLLVGCGNKDAENSDITTVTVWSGNSHSKAVVTEYIEEWNNTIGKKKGVKVDYIVQGGDMTQAIDLAIKTNKAPAMFTYPSAKALAEEGKIVAMEDIPGTEELMEKYKPYIRRENCAIVNDKAYNFPISATTQGLIYNKEMFKEAGIVDENGEAKPPKTLDEVREYAKKLTDKEKKQFGIILPIGWSGWYGSDIGSMMLNIAGRGESDPKTGVIDNTPIIPAMEMMLGIKEDGSYYPGAETLDNDTARARFAEGNIGMKFGYSFDVGVFNDQFPAKCDWGVAPLPGIEEESKYKQTMSIGGGYLINAAEYEKIGAEKMVAVLEMFYGDDYIRHMYKNGVALPVDFSIVEDIDIDDGKKGWREFAALAEISESVPWGLSSDTSGIKTLPLIFVEDIWSGKITDIEGTIKARDVELNERVKQYQVDHPEYDPSTRLIPDWDASR